MKLNLNSIIAIIVVLAFIGSMVSMAFNSNIPKEKTGTDIPETTIAQISYLAETDANVYMLENLYRIYAYTNEGDITKIDKEMIEKLNLKKITSVYDIQQELSVTQGLRYVADIVPKETEGIYEKLETVGTLKQIEYISRIGNVAIPKKIQAKNEDLNITKEIEMEKTLVSCMLDIDAQTNEEIQIMILITTQGQQVVKTNCLQISQ